LASDVGKLAEQWERNALEDPFGVILSDPTRTGRRWSEAEFFATGDLEWSRIAVLLDNVGAKPDPGGSYVDFGCGVGRMTRQLSRVFRTGVGIDVSEQMVLAARRFNPELEFVVNCTPDLGFIPNASIQFVYSHMVLQHLPPTLQETFLCEFLRILAPGGSVAFQVASEIQRAPDPAWHRIAARLPRPVRTSVKRLAGRPVRASAIHIEMHVLPHQVVEATVDEQGGTIVASPFTNSTDTEHNGAIRFFDRDTALSRFRRESGISPFLSRFYVVRRGADLPGGQAGPDDESSLSAARPHGTLGQSSSLMWVSRREVPSHQGDQTSAPT
jgi:trans-aconitate methyltransferase